ncbi:MAG: hypothetical protein ACFCD0_26280 [Gemmataceae bacterium]
MWLVENNERGVSTSFGLNHRQIRGIVRKEQIVKVFSALPTGPQHQWNLAKEYQY